MGIVKANGVYVKYNGKDVLEDINIEIIENEFLGIIGPNGGGKTTLLKVILGLIKPYKGYIEIDKDKNIAYVPQFVSFDKGFPISVLDVILMGKIDKKIKLFKGYSKKDIKLAIDIMKKLKIDEFMNRQIGSLSGGQMQKVLIARALINNSQILILDEPTSNIDSKSKIEIFEFLKELNRDMTIIIVSHDVDDIVLYVDSIACLNKKLHYHKNDKKLNKREFQEKYSCPVQFYLGAECNDDHCQCEGNAK